MKKFLIAFLIASLILSSSAVIVSAKTDKTPVISEKGIEKVVLVHYKAPGKPPWAGGLKDKPEGDDQGYKLFRGGVKWSDEALGTAGISYAINENISSDFREEIITAFNEWDLITGKEIFNDNVGTTSASGDNPDDGNVISWTNLGDSNIIAITTFWIWRGTKELAAFDIEFNNQLDWGINPDPEDQNFINEFDVRNIASHEVGHALVLEDLYQSQYSEMTMYGYSTEGEVKKISLEAGDIAGAQALYGAP